MITYDHCRRDSPLRFIRRSPLAVTRRRVACSALNDDQCACVDSLLRPRRARTFHSLFELTELLCAPVGSRRARYRNLRGRPRSEPNRDAPSSSQDREGLPHFPGVVLRRARRLGWTQPTRLVRQPTPRPMRRAAGATSLRATQCIVGRVRLCVRVEARAFLGSSSPRSSSSNSAVEMAMWSAPGWITTGTGNVPRSSRL